MDNSQKSDSVDKAAVATELSKLIAFCNPKKESMRLLRIAGPTWRHQAAGKESAYEEVVQRVGAIAKKLGIELPELTAAPEADPVKRKFIELLGAEYVQQLEQWEKVSYYHDEAFDLDGQLVPERYYVGFKMVDGIGDTVLYTTLEYYPATQQWCIPNIIDEEDAHWSFFDAAVRHYQSREAAIRKERYRFCQALVVKAEGSKK